MLRTLARGYMQGQNLTLAQEYERSQDPKALAKIVNNLVIESNFQRQDAEAEKLAAEREAERVRLDEQYEAVRVARSRALSIENEERAFEMGKSLKRGDLSNLPKDSDAVVNSFLDSF